MELDKAPFVVTLAVAIAGWSATHIVDRVTGSPTLEFNASEPVAASNSSVSDSKTQTIQLTNLTRATTFKDLTVILVARGNTRIIDEMTEILPRPPAFEGDEPWKYQGGMARYTIPRMHPGWTFAVRVGYTGNSPPVLRLESPDTVYSTSPNWETFVVRNELWILSAIALIWGLFVALYLFQNWRQFSDSRRQSAGAESASARKEGVEDETG